ncbi:MAG: hypothetical protein CR963_00485 [Gammaproteobacteria bacterium]|nr:MAG: hypothetical protein CR963_00485 [Gammaproteobacteria bacterium]
MEFIEPYKTTVLVMGLVGLALLIQLAISDVVGIKRKHTPGYPITADHSDFLFRASRAFSNTNETVAVFILFAAFAILSSADPKWLNAGAVVYLAGRIAHMLFYYSNLKLWRSIAFAVSLLGLITMFVAGLWAWF